MITLLLAILHLDCDQFANYKAPAVPKDAHNVELAEKYANGDGVKRNLDTAALSPAARVDLRLYNPYQAAQVARSVNSLFDAEDRRTARHRHAETAKDFLALILVDFHRLTYLRAQRG
jgi:hypothetical protein